MPRPSLDRAERLRPRPYLAEIGWPRKLHGGEWMRPGVWTVRKEAICFKDKEPTFVAEKKAAT